MTGAWCVLGSISKRTELCGLYITDIAAILTHDAITTASPPLHRHAHSDCTAGDASPVYGLSVVGTERVVVVYSHEKWRRDRMVEVSVAPLAYSRASIRHHTIAL
jgi:hypothetical protein